MQRVSKYNEHANAANQIRVFVCCIRLPAYDADVVISYNAPVWINNESASAEVVKVVHANVFWDAAVVAAECEAAVRSFTIHDYNIFPSGADE